MKHEKFDMRTMYDEIEWSPIIKSFHGAKRADSHDDDIVVKFFPSKKDSEIIRSVCINIGSNIAERLGWQYGDKIIVLHNPKNPFDFMLVRSENDNGFTLSKTFKNSKTFKVQFTWKHEKPLKKFSGVVDHFIKNRKLIIFNVNPHEETINQIPYSGV